MASRQDFKKIQHGDPEIVHIFEGWTLGDWAWCLHCGRAYQVGNYRLEVRSGLQYCPYDDCDGDAVMDAQHWEEVREKMGYPETPEVGEFYPLQ
ncbi:MAG: hypothetical protein HY687_01370 [Chloroflexi bacterium]|nr:hypothetical protein [Chloroflexota bacterium]